MSRTLARGVRSLRREGSSSVPIHTKSWGGSGGGFKNKAYTQLPVGSSGAALPYRLALLSMVVVTEVVVVVVVVVLVVVVLWR